MRNLAAVSLGIDSGQHFFRGNVVQLGQLNYGPSLTFAIQGSAPGTGPGPVEVELGGNDFYDEARFWSRSALNGGVFRFTDGGGTDPTNFFFLNIPGGAETLPPQFLTVNNQLNLGNVSIGTGSVSNDPADKNFPDFAP